MPQKSNKTFRCRYQIGSWIKSGRGGENHDAERHLGVTSGLV